MREMSEEGKAFIKRREALLLTPTWDKIGEVWNIGFGHVYKDDEPHVNITPAEGHALFDVDIHYRSDFVDERIKVETTQAMFDACCSLAYNIGTDRFASSSILLYLNDARYADAAVSFLLYRIAKGQYVEGLLKRRAAEMVMFAEGIYLP